jgi:hypothetical protein
VDGIQQPAAAGIKDGGKQLAEELGKTAELENAIKASTVKTLAAIEQNGKDAGAKLDAAEKQVAQALVKAKAKVAPTITTATRAAAARLRTEGAMAIAAVRGEGAGAGQNLISAGQDTLTKLSAV